MGKKIIFYLFFAETGKTRMLHFVKSKQKFTLFSFFDRLIKDFFINIAWDKEREVKNKIISKV